MNLNKQSSDISILKKRRISNSKESFHNFRSPKNDAPTILHFKKQYQKENEFYIDTEEKNNNKGKKNNLKTRFDLNTNNTHNVNNIENSLFNLTAINSNSVFNLPQNAKMLRTKEENEALNSAKKEFLNYILTENTKYADIERIEEELKSQLELLKESSSEILKKKKQKISLIHDIEKQIDQEIILQKHISKQKIIDDFNNKIKEVKTKISLINYDYTSSLKIYTRTKEENEYTKKELNNIFKQAKLINDQYKKFILIKTSVFNTLSKEERVFLDMQEFQSMRNINYVMQFEKRKEVFNDLDFKLFLARNLTVQGENILNQIKQKQLAVKENMIKINRKNDIKKKDIKYLEIEIKQEIINTGRLNNMLKVEDINEIVKAYKDTENLLSKNRSEFNFLNKEILRLNEEYARLIFVLNKKKEICGVSSNNDRSINNNSISGSNAQLPNSNMDNYFDNTLLSDKNKMIISKDFDYANQNKSNNDNNDYKAVNNELKETNKIFSMTSKTEDNENKFLSSANQLSKETKLELAIEEEILDQDEDLKLAKLKLDKLKEKNLVIKDEKIRLELTLKKIMAYILDGIAKLLEVKIAMSDNSDIHVSYHNNNKIFNKHGSTNFNFNSSNNNSNSINKKISLQSSNFITNNISSLNNSGNNFNINIDSNANNNSNNSKINKFKIIGDVIKANINIKNTLDEETRKKASKNYKLQDCKYYINMNLNIKIFCILKYISV